MITLPSSLRLFASILIRHRPICRIFQIRGNFIPRGPEISISMTITRRISTSIFTNCKENEQDKTLTGILENYELICPITESYYGQVITHMRNNFLVDEPTQKMIGKNKRGEPIPILERNYLDALEEGLSIMYIHIPTNQIAALSVNGIFTSSEIVAETDVNVDDEDIRMICNLFANIHRCLNLFEKYGVDRIFDIKAVSVDENHRKRGLARAIIEKSIDIAKACGCKVIKTEGTSKYSQIAFARSGFETVWERNYTAFICENGDPVFQPIDPHRTLKIMTKVLHEDEE